MIAALVWKEYREQRVAWAALAAVGALAVFVLPLIESPENPDHTREAVAGLAVTVLAWAYGLICGAMLLAGERETGTLPFLDGLPGLRAQLWRAKCLAGVLLVIAQVAVLMGLAAAAGVFAASWPTAAGLFLAMPGAALFGLAWGLLFSALGRSVLNMILLSMAAQLAAAVLFLLPAAIVTATASAVLDLPPSGDLGLAWAAVAAFSIPVALGASAFIFSRPDRGRLRPTDPPAAATDRVDPLWRRLLWLCWRQSRGFAAGLGVFSVLLGFLVLANGAALWPAATLLVGVLCGATAFADEQQGPVQFLGDQRFPLSLFWTVKVGFRFLLAIAAAVIVLVPSLVRALAPGRGAMFPDAFWARAFHSALLAHFGPPELFLVVWLVCGFCAGVLCGLLLRNGLASGLLALGLGLLLAGVWVPSMLGGGLGYWQPLGPPLLLLASTPLLMRSWAAGRVASWSVAARLAPFVALAALWTAFGLWRRVAEIPDVAPKDDLAAFTARMPKSGDDPAGECVRAACARFANLQAQLDLGRAPSPPRLPGAAPASGFQRIADAARDGWSAADADLDVSLDLLWNGGWSGPGAGAAVAGFLASDHGPLLAASAVVPDHVAEWRAKLAEAADLKAGMAEDPRRLTVADEYRSAEPGSAPAMAVVLAADGLRRQAHGDDAAFLDDLRVGLALMCNLRHCATRRDAALGRAVENILLIGTARWLDRLNGRPDLLRQALDLISQRGAEAEGYDDDRVFVDRLIARNTLDEPLGWLTNDLAAAARGPYGQAREEAALVVEARMAPWEHAREERLARVLFDGDPEQRRRLRGPWGGEAMLGSLLRLDPDTNYPPPDGFLLCRPAATRLMLALRLYQADHGRPADKLDELVPQYLPKLPDDPFAPDQTFHYRASKGENIVWPPDAPGPPPRAGDGVLWSVGPDGNDDGGVRQTAPGGVPSPGEDVIFRVPAPAKGR